MKSARKGIEDVTSSDRISHLPYDLLFRILSLLSISDAMKTSLLSKQWRSVWKMMPTLEYDEYSCPNIGNLRFDEFCGRSFRLHEAPVLKTLTLELSEPSDSIDTLLFPNIRSTLLNITITCTSYPCYDSPIRFPSNLNIFQTLAFLKLQDRIRLDVVDSPVCFPSLKIMHLTRVQFSCKESFRKLLSACPVLEDLFLERLCSDGSFLFTISVPSLQRLSFTKKPDLYYDDDPSLEINAPSLKYLKIKDKVASFNFVEDMPKLMEADVLVHESKTEQFLRFFTSVEFLVVHLFASVVLLLADKISHRLVHLELHLLKHSPKLKVLKLNEKHLRHTQKIKDQPRSICDPSSVPECLSFHLETFQWRGYEGTEEEKEVAVYILQNARCLKTAKISIYAEGPRGGENDLITIKELKSMSKASTSCKLIIQLNNFS